MTAPRNAGQVFNEDDWKEVHSAMNEAIRRRSVSAPPAEAGFGPRVVIGVDIASGPDRCFHILLEGN